MARKRVERYEFVGSETEVIDRERFERAMRAWTGYLVRRVAEERVRQRKVDQG